MDLKTLRSELRKLSSLVDGWEAGNGIPALERDLALEKLRKLYEEIGFSQTRETQAEETPASPQPVEMPVSIDLDEMLSLDAGPEPEEFMQEQGAVAAVSGPEPEVFTHEQEVVSAVSGPETAQSEEEQAVEPFIGEPAEEPAVEVPAVGPAVEGPAPVGIAVPAGETTQEPVMPEPFAEGPVEEPAHVGIAVPAAEKTQEPVMPSLFGSEVETVRHRHKQRVIMSLYDNEPAVSAPKTAASAAAGPAASDALKSEIVPEPVSRAVPKEKTQPEQRNFAADHGQEEEITLVESPAGTQAAEERLAGQEESRPAARETGAVLGEVINQDVRTLADTIAPPRDIALQITRSGSVADLRSAIGINDKFLMIRDLFGGDGEAYERAIDQLGGFDSLDDCMIYIAENYVWNANSDGAKFLMELLERKYA